MPLYELEKKEYGSIIIIALLSIGMYFINNAYITMAVAVVSTLYFFQKRQFGGCMASYVLLGSFISVSNLFVAYMVMLILLLIGSRVVKAKMSNVFVILTALVVMFASYILGYKSELTIFILAILSLFLYVGIKIRYDYKIGAFIFNAYVAYGLVILSIVGLTIFSGGSVFKYGRIAFQGNIRNVANACVIPLLFLTTSFISGSRVTNQKKRWQIIITAILLLGLIATISRGSIVALLVAVIVSLLLSRNLGNKYLKFIIVGVLAIGLFMLLSKSNSLHFNHLFVDEEGGFNGRTDIWKYYWGLMQNGGIIHTLFGLGPGDIKRLSYGMNMYSHSTFLDIIFSYGIVGGTFMVGAIISSIIKTIKSKSVVLIAALAGLLTNYFSHGTVANFTFYVVLALIVATSEMEAVKNNDAK